MIQEYHVTTFSGVPYSFSILKRIGLDRFDLSSVRYVTQAGGKLPKEDVEYWDNYFKKRGIDLIVMYGQTEATARMSYLPSAFLKNHSGSIGIAIPGGRFSIIKGGKIITTSESEGELVYQGDNVSMGYAENKGGSILNAMIPILAGYLRAFGYTKQPLIATVTGNILNLY